MPAPTIEEVRLAFETDIDDVILQGLIDSENAEVLARFGAATSETDELAPTGAFLFLNRKAASISSVVEIWGVTELTLAANDYRIRGGGYKLERLATGTNGQYVWAPRVLVNYAVTEDPRRHRIVIDLCKLALQYQGLRTVKLGDRDFESEQMDYQKEREQILSTLSNSVLAF